MKNVLFIYGYGGSPQSRFCTQQSLEEIADTFKLSRERVRQNREKAIRRLRHSSKSLILTKYLS